MPLDPAVLQGELELTLADALRRSTTRAEFMRLTRIQSLFRAMVEAGS